MGRGGTLRASLALYHATWSPTEQIPERAIGTLIRDEFGALDPDLRGRTDRSIASLRFDSDDWRASAYVQHYNWNLLSNFTFYLDDPVNGDQLQQVDKRLNRPGCCGGRLV
ncbi:hypothetical protein C404_14960 [Ralstonia sp. AU12-08]|nr:hypothetical protein C404_14960 [Ralstonia sp. AU12-08]